MEWSSMDLDLPHQLWFFSKTLTEMDTVNDSNYGQLSAGATHDSGSIDGFSDLDEFFQAFSSTAIPPDFLPLDEFDIGISPACDSFPNSESYFLSNSETSHFMPNLQPPSQQVSEADFSDDQQNPISKKRKTVPSDDTLYLSESETSKFNSLSPDSMIEPDKQQQRFLPNPLLGFSRTSQEADSASSEEHRGMLVIHLSIALAEAISSGSQDLAEVILNRLKKLVDCSGSNIERIGFYFFHGLQWILTGKIELDLKPHLTIRHDYHLLAYRVLIEIYPCCRIAHFTANQSILESIPEYSRNLHILDFDLMDGIQWPPLMKALVSEGYSVEHIRLTAIKWADSPASSSTQTLERLQEFAEELGFSFSFIEVELESLVNCFEDEEEEEEEGGEEEKEETVIANCMFKLFHMFERSSWQVSEFLQASKVFNPRVFTLGYCNFSEEDGSGDTVSRLTGCLQLASAVCDSLEFALPTQGLARQLVEKLFLGPRFCRELMFESKESNVEKIPEILGFVRGRISDRNIEQAHDLLRLQAREGHFYRIETASENELSLAWGSTCLLSASSWHVQ